MHSSPPAEGNHVYLPLSMDEEKSDRPLLDAPIEPAARQSKWKDAIKYGILVAAVASSAYTYTVHQKLGLANVNKQSQGSSDVAQCDIATARPINAPKTNVWKNLDVKTAVDVREWLFDPEQKLNLTRNLNAHLSDNVVMVVEAWRPNKKDALKYIDLDGQRPDQYARAIISHGSFTPPVIKDYLIGPLPITPLTHIRPLSEIYTNPEIPFNARLFTYDDGAAIKKFMAREMGAIADITMDLFGVKAIGELNDTLVMGGQAPMSFDGSFRRTWCPAKYATPGYYLHPLDLQLYVDMTSLDVSDWSVLKVWYNSQIFNSTAAFRSAWESGTLQRSAKPDLKDVDWSTRKRKGSVRDLDDRAGPRQVSFGGPRFRVDDKERYVTWMGWSFYMGFERDMGLSLWDIAFKGERIIYELQPQEAMAQYSGLEPAQSSTVWLDRAFGMGQLARTLMKGYDCPADAHYLSATVHPALGSVTQPDAICIFERDSGKPISRHWAPGKDEMGATKGYELVVRSIATVGNYDYIFDYTFMLDSSLEIRVSASGYVQGGFYDGNSDRQNHGQRIQQSTMGGLHDHVINYKVDFDINGTANSAQTVKLETFDFQQPWFEEDDWGTKEVSHRTTKHILKTEDEGHLDYGLNSGGMVAITNEDSRNAWGVPRGYAIHPGANNIHLTNIHSKRTLKNLEWAKHNLHVVRQKDSEPYSSNMFNINLPGKPPVDFGSFFDGESLDQEDLVLYLNLGTHHIIRAEDSPHTLTNTATSYVTLMPYNFHDSDVSMESQNSVLVNAGAAGEEWQATGGIEEEYCIPGRVPKFSYSGEMKIHSEGASDANVQYEILMDAEQLHGLKAEL